MIDIDSINNNVTQGEFATEKEAADWLFHFLESTQNFHIYRELCGSLLHKKHRQKEVSRLRCDFLLIPFASSKIKFGAVVIEAKRSGEKIGPSLSQLMDYLNCSFEVENGINVIPSYGFSFPCQPQHCAVASIMSHQGIGSCSITWNGEVVFSIGEERILQFDRFGEITFLKESKSGKGVGSR